MNQNLIWSDLDKLPVWSLAEFEEEAAKSNALIMINGFAVDVSLFSLDHPGTDFDKFKNHKLIFLKK